MHLANIGFVLGMVFSAIKCSQESHQIPELIKRKIGYLTVRLLLCTRQHAVWPFGYTPDIGQQCAMCPVLQRVQF